jgi:hypothetical protein
MDIGAVLKTASLEGCMVIGLVKHTLDTKRCTFIQSVGMGGCFGVIAHSLYQKVKKWVMK